MTHVHKFENVGGHDWRCTICHQLQGYEDNADMNLTEFSQLVKHIRETSSGPGSPVVLTLEQAEWLLEGLEKDRDALNYIERDSDGFCFWCFKLRGHNPEGCLRQLALAHWSEP